MRKKYASEVEYNLRMWVSKDGLLRLLSDLETANAAFMRSCPLHVLSGGNNNCLIEVLMTGSHYDLLVNRDLKGRYA